MKATLQNGVVVEGSPQEIAEFINAPKHQTETKQYKKKYTKQPWTKQEEEYLAKHNNVSASVLAEALGKSVAAVNNKLYRLTKPNTSKKKANHYRPWTTEQDAYIKKNYGKIKTSKIAKALSRTKVAIRTRFQTLKK